MTSTTRDASRGDISSRSFAARLRTARKRSRFRPLASAALQAIVLALWLAACGRLFAFGAATRALFATLGAFVFFCVRAAVVIFKTSRLETIARRLEKRIDREDLFTSALDFETSPALGTSEELRRATIELANELFDALAPREKSACFDAPRSSRRLVASILLSILPCAALLLPIARSNVGPSESERVETVRLLDEDELGEKAFDGASSREIDEALKTLVASLERARDAASALADEARAPNGSPDALFARERETRAALDSFETGTFALVETFLDAIERESASADMRRGVLLRSLKSRALVLRALLSDERRERGALTRSFVAKEREKREDAARRAETFAEKLDRERRALDALGLGFELAARSDAFESDWRDVRALAIELLRERVGTDPYALDVDRAPTEAFVVRVEALARAQEDARGALESFYERVSQEDPALWNDALAEIERDALAPEREDWDAAFQARDERLTAIERGARAERWGAVATDLDEGPAPSLTPTIARSESSAARFAWILAFGPGAARTDATSALNDAPLTTRSSSERAETTSEFDEPRALDANAREEERALVQNESETTSDASSLAVERERSNGDGPDLGANPDATNSGGGSARDASSPNATSDDAGGSFVVELPDDLRERLDAAKKWRAPEKEEERSRAYRRRLWRESLRR